MDNNFFVYVLKCSDNTLYTGYTNNLEKRLKVHNSGKASKYTRGRLPVEYVYNEAFEYKSEAMSREAEIKKLSKEQKLKLIMSENNGGVD